MSQNREILFVSRPAPHAELSNFEVRDCDYPAKPAQGQILIRLKYVSVDPYMRGRMSAQKSYAAGWELGKNPIGGTVAEVIESGDDKYQKGDLVTAYFPWKLFQTIPASYPGMFKLPDPLKSHPSVAIGVVGMTGLTALLSLDHIAEPKEGDVAFVSGAAGAVGTVVGQLLKLKGCKVYGSAGSDDKVQLVKDLGFDDCMNYKTENLNEKLKAWAPDGLDIYYDNVGGATLETALDHMKRYGRIVACGSISNYDTPNPYGIKNIFHVTTKSLKMQGFIVSDWINEFPSGLQRLAELFATKKLKAIETVREGFDTVPAAFLEILKGANVGKMVVKV